VRVEEEKDFKREKNTNSQRERYRQTGWQAETQEHTQIETDG
jgi:hypothetical protein